MSRTPASDGTITPFLIEVPDAEISDLRRRLTSVRWPEPATVDDWSQGVPLRYLQGLADYWAHTYSWRTTEARLNRLPQFTTRIDGLDVHFIHVRSPQSGAIPVVMTHGWPGSFLEFEQTLAPLTDPKAHGASSAQPFDVVVPSLPGYAFTGKPVEADWGIHRIARAWVELMRRLGYERFVAQGSDWGTSVSTSIALQHPERVLGIHLVPPLAPADSDTTAMTDAERAAEADRRERARDSGYSAVHGSRPQTIGYSLVDSPVALCAWIVEKLWAWADHDGDLSDVLSPDQVLDNVSLYWLTRTGASSARLYWESIARVSEWMTTSAGTPIDVPTGCTVFPREVPRASRRWAARRFTNIVHWGEPKRGGHFGAWEQPEVFVDELRLSADRILNTSD
ncbi:epoxide hydrolase family protein [Mycolicibacterium sp. BiH015]|uniref:epoxide hydrolase family protein n=1 Tax=Mycolicibacterium sp. BiH015 TaxID=3018808 RepID=UPI003FA53EEA